MDIGKAKQRSRPRPSRKRVGRGVGSGHGKTAGRGHKGARSRSGWSSRGMSGGAVPLWRRLPQRGFTNAPFRRDYCVVNVAQLERFPEGAVVTPEELRRHNLIKGFVGAGVKVLGEGELSKPLTVRADAFSETAARKIEAAGGTVERIPGRQPPARRRMGSAPETPEE